MPNAVGPGVIRYDYTSAFGPHSAFVPTLTWEDTPATNDKGNFQTWNSGNIDALDMITDLLDVLLPFHPEATIFNNWTIFTQADPDAPLLPVASGAFSGAAGTSTLSGWSKAMQRTLSWRTTGFNQFKIVMLDIPNTNSWEKLNSLPGSGIFFDLDAVVTDSDHGFSGRDNNKPETFVAATYTMNEKLRKAYRLS